MNGFLVGLIGGMFVCYAFLHPESVNKLCVGIVAQIKKLFGKK